MFFASYTCKLIHTHSNYVMYLISPWLYSIQDCIESDYLLSHSCIRVSAVLVVEAPVEFKLCSASTDPHPPI